MQTQGKQDERCRSYYLSFSIPIITTVNTVKEKQTFDDSLPTPLEATSYREQCLELIQPDSRTDYTWVHLLGLRDTGALRRHSDWSSFYQSLKIVPEGHRIDFTQDLLPPMKEVGALERPQDWLTHAKHYSLALDLVSEKDRSNHAIYGLPALAEAGALKTEGDWKAYLDSMKLIPESERADYTEYTLPPLKLAGALESRESWGDNAVKYAENTGYFPPEARQEYASLILPKLIKKGFIKSADDWAGFNKTLSMLPASRRMNYVQDGLLNMEEKGGVDWDMVADQIGVIKEYALKFKDLDFIWKTGVENIGRLRPPESPGRLLKFKKTGSRLNPLDGAKSGVIIRTITEKSYEAWVQASEAGIPCEEILKYQEGHPRQGQYRVHKAKDGNVRVACLYGGQDIPEFMRNPENSVYAGEIEKQRIKIIMRLHEEGITHGHEHENNFVVSLKDNKPHVRIIDFDQATSP
jgi:hypothetical protein